MKMSEGVEWAAHACTVMAALPPDKALRAEALAAYHALAPAYMAKHLQALARAGIVASSRGPKGGYWLAKEPAQISLWEIVAAIDGGEPAFRCSEIRRRGPCPTSRENCKKPCPIARSFHSAETAMRDALSGVTIQSICLDVAAGYKPADAKRFGDWMVATMTDRPPDK